MSLDPRLLTILACPDPDHRAPLTLAADELSLICTQCGNSYEIRDGIPVLLLEEATPAATSGS